MASYGDYSNLPPAPGGPQPPIKKQPPPLPMSKEGQAAAKKTASKAKQTSLAGSQPPSPKAAPPQAKPMQPGQGSAQGSVHQVAKSAGVAKAQPQKGPSEEDFLEKFDELDQAKVDDMEAQKKEYFADNVLLEGRYKMTVVVGKDFKIIQHTDEFDKVDKKGKGTSKDLSIFVKDGKVSINGKPFNENPPEVRDAAYNVLLADSPGRRIYAMEKFRQATEKSMQPKQPSGPKYMQAAEPLVQPHFGSVDKTEKDKKQIDTWKTEWDQNAKMGNAKKNQDILRDFLIFAASGDHDQDAIDFFREKNINPNGGFMNFVSEDGESLRQQLLGTSILNKLDADWKKRHP